MMLRSLRAIFLGGLALVVVLAIAGQWVGFQLDLGTQQLVTGPRGMLWSHWPEGSWGLQGIDQRGNRGGYFDLPGGGSYGKLSFFFVPWWMIVPAVALPAIGAAVAVKRRGKRSRGFPVEAT